MTKEGGPTRQTELNTKGIYDNPVSSNHQAPSHWKNNGNLDTYHMLTEYCAQRDEQAGGQIVENCPEASNRRQNDLTSETEL